MAVVPSGADAYATTGFSPATCASYLPEEGACEAPAALPVRSRRCVATASLPVPRASLEERAATGPHRRALSVPSTLQLAAVPSACAAMSSRRTSSRLLLDTKPSAGSTYSAAASAGPAAVTAHSAAHVPMCFAVFISISNASSDGVEQVRDPATRPVVSLTSFAAAQ